MYNVRTSYITTTKMCLFENGVLNCAESCKQQKMLTCPAKGPLLPAIISELSLFCRCRYCEYDV